MKSLIIIELDAPVEDVEKIHTSLSSHIFNEVDADAPGFNHVVFGLEGGIKTRVLSGEVL